MKRNSYCILMVLFILAACTQPQAELQAATATQEVTATTDLIVESEIEQKGEYPQNSENFIFGDSRTNDDIEKAVQDIIDNPEYGYSEILNLYRAKLDQMGVDNNNYRAYISTNPNGPGWTLTIVKDGEMYIPINKEGVPHADLIISPTASLDSFDLLKVTNTKGLKIIWDESNWPAIINNSNTEWYAMGQSPIEWEKIETTQEVEGEIEQESKVFVINNNFPILSNKENKRNVDDYSEVDLNDFLSGDILKQELSYINENQIFSSNVIPQTKLLTESYTRYTKEDTFSVTVETIDFTNNYEDYKKNPDTRPLKIISYYKFFDENLFKDMGMEKAIEFLEDLDIDTALEEKKRSPRYWVVSWAYYNPDNTITIGHTFFDQVYFKQMLGHINPNNDNNKFLFFPGIKHLELIPHQEFFHNFHESYWFLEELYKRYPDLNPYKDGKNVEEWLNSGQMSLELQNALFTFQTHWLQY